jgi:hypothetical protein
MIKMKEKNNFMDIFFSFLHLFLSNNDIFMKMEKVCNIETYLCPSFLFQVNENFDAHFWTLFLAEKIFSLSSFSR